MNFIKKTGPDRYKSSGYEYGLRIDYRQAIKNLAKLLRSRLRLFWCKQRPHEATLRLNASFGCANIGRLLYNPFKDFPAQLGMNNLASTKHEGEFDFISPLQEFLNPAKFCFEIMLIDGRPELNLFGLGLPGFLPGLFHLALFLVLQLVIIHNLADGRTRIGSNFHQVEFRFFRHPESFFRRYDANLVSLRIDKSNFANADVLINPGLLFSSDSKSPPENKITGEKLLPLITVPARVIRTG